MVEIKYIGDALRERIERAVASVKDRLRRVIHAAEWLDRVPLALRERLQELLDNPEA